MNALRDRKLAEGLTPQQIMADPEVQDAMARVFRPDYNAAPADAITASDTGVYMRRAREQDARAAVQDVPEFPLQGGGQAGGAPMPGEAGFAPPRPAEPFAPNDQAPGEDEVIPGPICPLPPANVQFVGAMDVVLSLDPPPADGMSPIGYHAASPR